MDSERTLMKQITEVRCWPVRCGNSKKHGQSGRCYCRRSESSRLRIRQLAENWCASGMRKSHDLLIVDFPHSSYVSFFCTKNVQRPRCFGVSCVSCGTKIQ